MLNFRNTLIESEKIIEGKFWDKNMTTNQVSVAQEQADILGLTLGSEIVFNVQEIRLSFTVTSIRTIDTSGNNPFFYFIVTPHTVTEAPQNYFSFLENIKDVSKLQNELAEKFPNISTIKGKQIVNSLQEITNTLSSTVLMITNSALLVGVFMLIGLLMMNAFEKTHDFNLMKIIGATKYFLWKLYLLEILFYLILSFVLAYCLSAIIAAILNIWIFDFSIFYWSFDAWYIFIFASLIVLCVGVNIMRNIFSKSPIEYLQSS